MTIEALLTDIRDQLARNNELLAISNAGREEALSKLSSATTAAEPKTRSRKKTEPESTPAAADGTAAAAPAAAAPAAAKDKPAADISDDAIRALAGGWLQETDDKAERERRGGIVKSLLDHFGVKTLVGPDGIKEDDQRQQVIFYLKRAKAGLQIDFGVDYDFDGDPEQGAAAPADDFDGIG